MTPFVYNALAIDSSHPTGMSTGAASESMKLLKEGKEESDAFEDAKATPCEVWVVELDDPNPRQSTQRERVRVVVG